MSADYFISGKHEAIWRAYKIKKASQCGEERGKYRYMLLLIILFWCFINKKQRGSFSLFISEKHSYSNQCTIKCKTFVFGWKFTCTKSGGWKTIHIENTEKSDLPYITLISTCSTVLKSRKAVVPKPLWVLYISVKTGSCLFWLLWRGQNSDEWISTCGL